MRKISALRLVIGALVSGTVMPAVVHAHPGHDGHELTWDFGHLAAHPGATIFWVAVAGVTLWSAVRIVRTRAETRAVARVKRERS